MVRDMNLFFDPESKEYVIVSEGHTLKLNKEDFKSVKKSMNGISHGLRMKYKEMKDRELKA